MKTNYYLLPHYWKKIGWIVSIPSAIVLLSYLFNPPWDSGEPFDFFGEKYWYVLEILIGDQICVAIIMALLIIGLLFIAFSKQKVEDEYITKMRGDSLIWAVIANSLLLMLSFMVIYDGWFLYVSFFNLYTLLVLYIIKFNVALYRFKKMNSYEE